MCKDYHGSYIRKGKPAERPKTRLKDFLKPDLSQYKITFPIDEVLEKDLIALIEGVLAGVSYVDCLQSEVWGDINAAYNAKMLTREQTDFLLNNFVFSTNGIK